MKSTESLARSVFFKKSPRHGNVLPPHGFLNASLIERLPKKFRDKMAETDLIRVWVCMLACVLVASHDKSQPPVVS